MTRSEVPSISKSITSRLITKPTNSVISNPLIGSIMLAVRKSRKSKNVNPAILYSAQMLNENTLPKPRTQAVPAMTKFALVRPICFASINHATQGSSSEIAELHAAIETKTKNTAPISSPPGILPKATGRLINMSPGPALGSIPGVANTIEKMINPEIIATELSKNATIRMVLPIFAFCGI